MYHLGLYTAKNHIKSITKQKLIGCWIYSSMVAESWRMFFFSIHFFFILFYFYSRSMLDKTMQKFIYFTCATWKAIKQVLHFIKKHCTRLASSSCYYHLKKPPQNLIFCTVIFEYKFYILHYTFFYTKEV